jgi:hypothetical protein
MDGACRTPPGMDGYLAGCKQSGAKIRLAWGITEGETEMTDQSDGDVRYLGVACSSRGIAAVYGARVDSFVARSEIREVILRHGRAGERRIVQLLFGVGMVGFALYQLFTLAVWGPLVIHSVYKKSMLIFLIPLALGIWALWDLFQARWYLEVRTFEKSHLFLFNQKVKLELLQKFLEIGIQFGYPIDRSKFNDPPG